MTTVIDFSPSKPPLGGSDTITWSGVTNGAISLSPTGSSGSPLNTKILTIPLTTGSVPLGTGIWALVWMSWIAKTSTAGKFSVAERRFITSIAGASSIGSYVNSGIFTGPSVGLLPSPAQNCDLVFEAPRQIDTYVQITPHVNTSGDLEIYLNCLATDDHGDAGVSWDFTGLSAEYQIIGCA